MNIINTPVLLNSSDAFWTPSEQVLNQLQKKPVLVISRPFPAESPAAAQLEKILSACQINPNHYCLVQIDSDQQVAWHVLNTYVAPLTVFLLGIEPAQLAVKAQFMPHQVSRFNQVNWIPTFDLDTLQEQPMIKTHLWKYGLKPVFIDQAYGPALSSN